MTEKKGVVDTTPAKALAKAWKIEPKKPEPTP